MSKLTHAAKEDLIEKLLSASAISEETARAMLRLPDTANVAWDALTELHQALNRIAEREMAPRGPYR